MSDTPEGVEPLDAAALATAQASGDADAPYSELPELGRRCRNPLGSDAAARTATQWTSPQFQFLVGARQDADLCAA